MKELEEEVREFIRDNFLNYEGKIEVEDNICDEYDFTQLMTDSPYETFYNMVYEEYTCWKDEDIAIAIYHHFGMVVDSIDIHEILSEFEYSFEDMLNKKFYVTISLNNGDMNYEYMQHNLLNWLKPKVFEYDTKSSLNLLATLLRCKTSYKRNLKKAFNNHEIDTDNTFVRTAIYELENNAGSCSEVVALCTMTLRDILDYYEVRAKLMENPNFDHYNPQRFKEDVGKVWISKDSNVGLFERYAGGGSILEIELPKDVYVPLQNVLFILPSTTNHNYGYCVDDVYGLVLSNTHGAASLIPKK